MDGAGTSDTRSGGQPDRAGSSADLRLPDLSRLRLETLLGELIDRAGEVLENEARLHRLLNAVVSIGRSLAYADIIESTIRTGRELVSAGHSCLVVLGPGRAVQDVHTDQDRSPLERLLPHGPNGEYLLGPPLDQVLADGQPVRLPDECLLGVPLRVRDELFGVLCLFDKAGEPFGQTDEDVAVALTAAAGIAIENSRLYEATVRRERWLAASTEIMTHLLGEATLRTTLDVIAERARSVANCDLVLLALLDSAKDRLVIEVTAGAAPQRLLGLATPIQGGSLADVVLSGEPRLYTRDPAAAAWLPELYTNADLDIELGSELNNELDLARGSALLVPLTAGTDAMGVLAMARTVTATPFDTLDLRLAATFAGHAALALESARARADREELAVFQDRDRIAGDLHERVIQRLFGVALGLQGLLDGLIRQPFAGRISGYVRELDATIEEIRRTVFSLPSERGQRSGPRMRVLDEIELTAGPLGLEPRVELIGPLDTGVPEELLPELLATVREALTVLARGGPAGQPRLIVHADVHAATLTVRIDGTDGADATTEPTSDRFGVEAGPNGEVSLVWRIPLPG